MAWHGDLESHHSGHYEHSNNAWLYLLQLWEYRGPIAVGHLSASGVFLKKHSRSVEKFFSLQRKKINIHFPVNVYTYVIQLQTSASNDICTFVFEKKTPPIDPSICSKLK